MQYLQAKATVTPTTDLGEFRALVATYHRDRTGDEIKSGAFAKSISEWREVGRRVPLHWNHESDLIVGDVDPAEMRETDDGLEVSGHLDLDDELGRKVWKSLKRDRVGFSFGYVVTRSEEREDGGLNLLEIDLFEVSATPSPMNNRTRILDTKSAATATDDDLSEQLSESEQRILRSVRQEWQARRRAAEAEEEEQWSGSSWVPLRKRIVYDGTRWRESLAEDPGGATDEEIRERGQRLADEASAARAIREARRKAYEQSEPVISVNGIRVSPKAIRVNGRPL